MIKNILFVVSMLLITTQTYANTYYNARYGFRIDYPDSFTPMGESENGDGQRFVKSNGEAVITAWGNYNLDLGNGDYLCSLENFLDSSKNLHITYKRKLRNGFVISGYSGEKIIYKKTIYKKDKEDEPNSVCLSFEIEYPTNQKNEYDKIVKEIANSFKPLEIEVL